ncbi:MAG: hypothetical protein IPP05_10425 [Cytophagaceae bacterium]|nr:hypothetical protein [Cytophagaceae bacterium]
MITTYLLGAGASANALPVVKQFSNSITETIEFLKVKFDNDEIVSKESLVNSYGVEITLRSIHFELLDRLRLFLEDCSNGFTIDELAKSYFFKKDEEKYSILKFNLSIFLSIRQILSKSDYRYFSFISQISNSQNIIPEGIKIVSWNYDRQFEIIESRFLPENKELNSLNRLSHRSKISNNYVDVRVFNNLYKLNGSNGFILDKKQIDFLDLCKRGLNSISYIEFLKTYFEIKQKIEEKDPKIKNTLSFAWEDSENYVRFYKDVWNEISKTEKLVVIGYSFPNFNSEIDLELFTKMQLLKKIYIQTLDEIGVSRKIKYILSKLNIKVDLEIFSNCDNFLTPAELD